MWTNKWIRKVFIESHRPNKYVRPNEATGTEKVEDDNFYTNDSTVLLKFLFEKFLSFFLLLPFRLHARGYFYLALEARENCSLIKTSMVLIRYALFAAINSNFI